MNLYIILYEVSDVPTKYFVTVIGAKNHNKNITRCMRLISIHFVSHLNSRDFCFSFLSPHDPSEVFEDLLERSNPWLANHCSRYEVFENSAIYSCPFYRASTLDTLRILIEYLSLIILYFIATVMFVDDHQK